MKPRRIPSKQATNTIPHIIAVALILLLTLLLPMQVSGLQDVITPTPTVTPTATVSPTPGTDYSNLSWLSTPDDFNALASSRNLSLLAGEMIFHDLVDASTCPGYGLLETGAANTCGEEAARNAVILWQNQFDQAIYDASFQYGIPPFVLKNVIMQESQFWPANHPTIYGYSEVGLGHVTQMGADTLLRWNNDFYKGFCRTVYDTDTCRKPYAFLDPEYQATLRGAALQVLNADCGNCKGSIDINRARASIPYIAATLKANNSYILWLLQGLTAGKPEKVFEGVDIWRFTLAGYNAGPGCISTAVHGTRSASQKVTWKTVSANFDEGCEGAVQYVDNVTQVYLADPALLANASTDQSTAAQLVIMGLGLAPTPVPTLDISTPTAVPTTDAASLTPLTPDTTSTDIATAETSTPVPTDTPEPVTETVMPESPFATSTPIPADIPSQPDVTASGEAVVKFFGVVPQFIAETVVRAAGGEVQGQVDALGLTVVSAPEGTLDQVVESLQNNLLVDYAEPNYLVQALYTPNDPGYAGQGYLLDMQIPNAWDVTQGEGIVVAVIDTGVDITHPDLVSNTWLNTGEIGADTNNMNKSFNGVDDDNDGYVDNWQGWNFVDANSTIADLHGHGTHSAGIIAAQMDNGEGLAGVAPLAKIMPLKALDDTGHGSYSQVAEAIIYAVDHGAKVINLGFGGSAASEVLLAATDYAYQHNVIVVAAAGNSGSEAVFYPAANPHVIAVSAVDPTLYLAPFSTYGSTVSLSAPGVGIYSTMPNAQYGQMNGTSMSAAQVSGAAALLASQAQFDTPDKVLNALVTGALDLGDSGYDIYFGNGLVQVFNALGHEVVTPVATAQPTATPDVAPTTLPDDTGNVTVMAQEVFWASAQACTGITNAANSIVPPDPDSFDNVWANCQNRYAPGSGWTISDMRASATQATTNYTSIYSTQLDIRFYFVSGTWVDDAFEIQICTSAAATCALANPPAGTWVTLEAFDSTNLPPTAVTTPYSYNVSTWVNTPAQVNNFQVRIWGTVKSGGGQADDVNIYLDQASLTVVQNTAPTISITSPSTGSSHVQGRLVTFTGSAPDAEEGALTGLIQWREGATLLGTGGSYSTSALSLGSHTITASVIDNRGLTASASITITIIANTAPVVNITAPSNGSSFAKGESIAFSGNATDAQDGNLSANLSWYSDIDGPLGTGASLPIDHLTPGTHTITAQVTDLDGAVGSAIITVTVTSSSGPHGNFSSSTDGCAACHRTHSAQSSGDLLNNPSSAFVGNDYCLSCHSTGSNAVSTHSNIDGLGKKEANFELLCVQCHDPHAGTGNLFAIRQSIHLGALPANFTSMTTTTGQVIFTSLTNADSFDEVDTPEDAANNVDDICVTCHVNASNPGAPISSHPGGANHLGNINYAGKSCISCHPHNADSNSNTKDGFMPVRGSCLGCHAVAQGTRRAIVGAGNDFSRSSHHVSTAVTDNDCVICHNQSQHMKGTVILQNVDTSSTVYVMDTSNPAAYTSNYDSFCLSCHDSNGAKGDTSPFSDNVNMAGTTLQIDVTAWNSASHTNVLGSFGGSCKDCHDNGHGSNKTKLLAPWNYVNDGNTDDGMRQEERFCYVCHDADGPSTKNVMSLYTRPTLWVQQGVGANNLVNLNDRHDIARADQTRSGVKIECVSCHNPHSDNSTRKVIADPDPGDGRIPGTGYFTQGNSTDFWTDWCLDCHDGSYPAGITPPTGTLVNIYGSMSVNAHGAASGKVGTLEGGFGYTTNSIVQCRQCHGIHVTGPTPVNNVTNLFSLLVRVRNAGNTADVPTDGGSFLYELTNVSVTTPSVSGYNWCQTCHVSSMGSNKTNCYACHYHGSGGKW